MATTPARVRRGLPLPYCDPCVAHVFKRLFPRRGLLLVEIEAALGAALQGGGAYETPDVDQLFETSLPLLRTALRTQFPGNWRVAVTGSFTHGSRYTVEPEEGKPCEIADLLFVVEYRLPQGESARNALLVQAKRSENDLAKLWHGDSTLKQLHFYSARPAFTWRTRGVAAELADEPRQLFPEQQSCPCPWEWDNFDERRHWSRWGATPDRGLYGGALFAVLTRPRAVALPPLDPVTQPVLLADTLCDLLMFTGGDLFLRQRQAYLPKPLGWSAVIWDVLHASRLRDHRRPRLSKRSWDRDPDESLLLDESGDDVQPPSAGGEIEENGVSVIRVSVDAREDEPPEGEPISLFGEGDWQLFGWVPSQPD